MSNGMWPWKKDWGGGNLSFHGHMPLPIRHVKAKDNQDLCRCPEQTPWSAHRYPLTLSLNSYLYSELFWNSFLVPLEILVGVTVATSPRTGTRARSAMTMQYSAYTTQVTNVTRPSRMKATRPACTVSCCYLNVNLVVDCYCTVQLPILCSSKPMQPQLCTIVQVHPFFDATITHQRFFFVDISEISMHSSIHKDGTHKAAPPLDVTDKAAPPLLDVTDIAAPPLLDVLCGQSTAKEHSLHHFFVFANPQRHIVGFLHCPCIWIISVLLVGIQDWIMSHAPYQNFFKCSLQGFDVVNLSPWLGQAQMHTSGIVS